MLITIYNKYPGDEHYILSIKIFDGEEKFVKFIIPGSGDTESIPDGAVLGTLLHTTFVDNNLWDLVNDFRISVEKSIKNGAFLLDIKAPKLFQLSWEDIFKAPAFSSFESRVMIIRYLPKPSLVLDKPFKLPVDVLLASDFENSLQTQPTEKSLRYFRTHRISGLWGDYLMQLMSRSQFEIVHLVCRAEINKDNSCVLIPGSFGSPVLPSTMVQLLKDCHTRFLILHCTDDNIGALLNFTHMILDDDGPTILVAAEPKENINWSFDRVYFDIVHDQYLDRTFHYIPKQMRPALLLASGGAGILKISALVPRLINQYTSYLQNSLNQREILKMKIDKAVKEGDLFEENIFRKRHDKLTDLFVSTQDDINNVYDFYRESGGMEPLKRLEMINSEINKQLKDTEAITKRVVNCWFRSGENDIKSDEKLEKESLYNYDLQIGAAKKSSILQDAIPFPDKELNSFYSEKGIQLRVELFSSDFIIPESSRILILPAPPDESEKITFVVKTPAVDGIARMRVCIYYEQNLVQSLLVQSIVGDFLSPDINLVGNSAVVDYSLSNNLTNLDRLPSRTLNIAVNENSSGTHSLFISGEGIKGQLDFGEGEITTGIKASRDALQNICSERDKQGRLKYRFDSDNKGNEKDFVTEIINLAKLGWKLYVEIIRKDRDKKFRDRIKNALVKPGAIIQVSSTKSSKYIFPWALVYDKPLLSGSNQTVCPQFLADMKKSDITSFISSQTCIQNGCPNKAEKKIICPSGFWGYKHIIEQPLSSNNDSSGANELSLEIKANANSSVMMGVSLELNEVAKHFDEIKGLRNVDVQYMDSRQTIEKGLDSQDFQVIYFYCHGGRNEHDTWLGIGKQEKLIPSDLFALELTWHLEHPFVFINGCHTTDVTPDDFILFNDAFADCSAAGVMGTEISITESLAQHFANGFLQRFLNGMKVGIAIREQRLTMLKNYNLLGLAYTPYCSADLKIIHS